MKRNTVKIVDDGVGRGRTVLNGIDISSVINGYRIVSRVGELTHVLLSVLVSELEIATDDVRIAIEEVRPEEAILQHVLGERFAGMEICSTCRQIVGNPRWDPNVCPGPMGKK